MTAEIARLLPKLGRDAEYVIRDLEVIRDELARLGVTLSPGEYQLISDTLLPIGILGSEILIVDLARTAAEELET